MENPTITQIHERKEEAQRKIETLLEELISFSHCFSVSTELFIHESPMTGTSYIISFQIKLII